MYNRNIENLREVLMIFIVIMLVIFTIAIVMVYVIKKSDEKKTLEAKSITVLEKIMQYGKIEWYLMEDEKGYRFKLRTFNADSLAIVAGDKGIIQYKGKTIVSFTRDKN